MGGKRVGRGEWVGKSEVGGKRGLGRGDLEEGSGKMGAGRGDWEERRWNCDHEGGSSTVYEAYPLHIGCMG